MSCLQNEILLEQWYEEALAETLKEYKDVAKAEEEAEKIAEEEISKVDGPLFHREDIGTDALIKKRVEHMESLR